jgi:hypothetical protein
MKGIKLFTLAAAVMVTMIPQIASADVWVDGYHRSNGTWVNGHYRSEPDGYFWNNYSSYGNTNPYTGEKGYRWPDNHSSIYNSDYDNDYNSYDYYGDDEDYSTYDECLEYESDYNCDEKYPAYENNTFNSWLGWFGFF